MVKSMKKFKVKVEKTVEAEDENDAVPRFIEWFYDADSNAEITAINDEVEVEEVKETKQQEHLSPEQEIDRLRQQEKTVMDKLNKNPEIMELLDALSAEEIIKRLNTTS